MSPASSRAAGRAQIEVLYLLGADEIDTSDLGPAFVVYQGHHGDRGAARADVILPGAAYTEKDGTYVNTEGRVQLGRRAVFPPGDAREDWTILRALSGAVGRPLPFDTLAELRRRLRDAHPIFAETDRVTPAAWGEFGEPGPVDPAPFAYPIADFYRTDPISRASADDGRVQRRLSRRITASCRRGPARMASFWSGYAGLTVITVGEVLAVVVPLLIAVAYLTYAERKVLAFSQLRKGPNVVGPFGLLQPFADGLKLLIKETIVPSGANRVVFIVAPIVTFTLSLVAWAVIPFDAGRGHRQHQCRHPLSVRDQLARRLRHHPRRLGVEFALRLSGRAALGGADGVLRGLDRLCPGHRAAVRRLAEPQRHRRGAAPYLVRGPAVADVRDLLHLRAWPRPTAPRSTWSKARPSWSPAISSNIRRWRLRCSISANTPT